MFDMTQDTTPPTDWRDTLAPGDVVLFRFPHSEPGDETDAKRRPCLVLAIQTLGGRRVVELAFATTAKTKANVGLEIHVNRPDSLAAAGLRKPTRFVCARRFLAPFDHVGWSVQPALAGLVYVAALPDRTLGELLDWADALRGDRGSDALDLTTLERIMPRLLVAYLASHVYTARPVDGRGEVAVTLTDVGPGLLVERTLVHVAHVALALHHDAGKSLVDRCEREWRDRIIAIVSAVIARVSTEGRDVR
jgi:hypothetical protein